MGKRLRLTQIIETKKLEHQLVQKVLRPNNYIWKLYEFINIININDKFIDGSKAHTINFLEFKH